MSDPTQVLARVAAFLGGLSATEVADLAAGRARLALLPAAADPAPPAPGVAPTRGNRGSAPAAAGRAAPPGGAPGGKIQDVERAQAALAAMSRREDGTAYLGSWTTRELRALAARLGLRGIAGLRKMELVERIVERTIGFRLNSTAIRQR
ncbi:Rho termination factor N-terminal domain-containing protein [Micromonospora sp. NPDC047740]|uniref:Rho termination factor N-terminal domain-containing protein n=1 Tax=Micromonospora sp. NPDC047740 TaxID=3364254 RepID=UPI00371A73FF